MSNDNPRERVRVHTGRAGFANGLPESIAAVAWAIIAVADAVKESKSK